MGPTEERGGVQWWTPLERQWGAPVELSKITGHIIFWDHIGLEELDCVELYTGWIGLDELVRNEVNNN